jgi:hypothetical protein
MLIEVVIDNLDARTSKISCTSEKVLANVDLAGRIRDLEHLSS